jgi:hypothetical protein
VLNTSQGQSPLLFIAPRAKLAVTSLEQPARGRQTRLMLGQQTRPASNAPQPPVTDLRHMSLIEREPLISNGRLTSTVFRRMRWTCQMTHNQTCHLRTRRGTERSETLLVRIRRSVEWASDTAPRLSSPRLATLLTPLTTDADVQCLSSDHSRVRHRFLSRPSLSVSHQTLNPRLMLLGPASDATECRV